ncbi:MAG: hypothetical protein M3Z66_15225, partial [Chloroflexota bacterium]|nr:hypothetical protein [Chloroflexota bacterium]
MTQEQTNKAPKYAAELLKGALAGGIATVPMTAFMLIAHRSLPFWQRSSLPPKKITMNIAHRIGLKKHMDEPQRRVLT